MSKWWVYFQLLTSIINTSFDTQPASFLLQFSVWKDRVVRYQQLSGDKLPDLVKLIAVVNGLKGNVRDFVLLNLRVSSFSDLDSLLIHYMHDQHEPSLESSCDRACRDQSESIRKGNDKESNPSFKQQLDEGGTHKEVTGKEKGRQPKREGAAYHPQPPTYKGKWEHAQLPKEQWCSLCRKKGHKTQACWWNTNQQRSKRHQQHQAWSISSTPRTSSTIEASRQRHQPQLYPVDQQTTYTSLAPDDQSMLSLEPQPQASTHSNSSPAFIAQLESFDAPSTAETWGILVDTGAATSVAPQSLLPTLSLAQHRPPFSLQHQHAKQ